MALAFDAWWDEPHYRDSYTPQARAEFILGKLTQRDRKKLQALMLELSGGARGSQSLTAPQWRTLLAEMGADQAEIAEVLARIGLDMK
jgi:hypothetical protein